MKRIAPNISFEAGKYRVRVFRDGTTAGGRHTELEDAIKERDALKALPEVAPPRHRHTDEDHARQLAMHPGETMRNIFRTRSGYKVRVSRGNDEYYGRHHKGPDALTRAIAARDLLEKLHPKSAP